jgi:hypothetical protein
MLQFKQLLIEGRYDAVTTALTRELVSAIKQKTKNGRIAFDFPIKRKVTIGDYSDLEYSPEIELEYRIQYKKNFEMGFDIYGQADDEEIQLVMTINPKLIPNLFSEIVPTLKDAIRHELEHVAQNLLDRPAAEKYQKVSTDNFFKYVTARHEIPAFVRGLYKAAKTRRRPMNVLIDKFLNDYSDKLTPAQSEKVRQIWTDYAMRNLPKAQFDR